MPGEPQRPNTSGGPVAGFPPPAFPPPAFPPRGSAPAGYPPPGYPPHNGPGGAYMYPAHYPASTWAAVGGYPAVQHSTQPPRKGVWSTRTTMLAIAAALVISSLGAVVAAAADKAPANSPRITGFQIPGNGIARNGFPGNGFGGNGTFGGGSTAGGSSNFGGAFPLSQ